MRVQEYLWARMKPADIARKMKKDKAWVSRTIKKLQDAPPPIPPTGQEIIAEELAQLDSLIVRTRQLFENAKDAKTQLAAIRLTADLQKQKSEYQQAVGLVQRSAETLTGEPPVLGRMTARQLREELPPSSLKAIVESVIAHDEKRAREKTLTGR